ncbi:polysaccharide deacetylase family protein [Desulfovibrio inopinatus]|uniref:polysaccharide deacetylase family protein n=1 Tax=Desulfovibrio inopinatus TaxID=102109 RepID=UPI00041D2B4B|nr:polysaccharide deacetylase family protein [Desulfovibrio inopinatus]
MTLTTPSWTDRDLRGYGPEPPDPQWPENARMAISIVINAEAGAELSLAQHDEANESVYEIIEPVRDVPNPCLSSHFDYGPRAGYWRIVRLLERFGISCTVSICGRTVDQAPWLAQDMAERGYELACHSYRWEGHANMSEDHERDIIARSVKAIETATGTRPLGWHTKGAASPNTRRLLVEAGFEYDSDAYNDDLPFLQDVAGKTHAVVPYSFITNDMRFMPIGNFVHGEDFARCTIDAFDWLQREGGRMMSIGLHPRLIGHPSRIIGLERFLDHAHARGKVWFARRIDIARHWRQRAQSL